MSAPAATASNADPSPPPPAPKPEAAAQELPKFNFELSPVPANPLGEGRYIKTAAALVIGCVRHLFRWWKLITNGRARRDEILNGKTLDRNSNYFARYCFEQGVEL